MDRSTHFLKTPSAAGVIYASSAFAIGFGLGTMRTLLLIPRVGPVNAVLLETPVILYASWIVSRYWTARLEVAADAASRVWMGAIGLGVLILCELGLSLLIFRRSVADFFADYASPAGAIGLVAQVLFATFPYLQTRPSKTSASQP